MTHDEAAQAQPALFDVPQPIPRRLSTPYAAGSDTSKAAAKKAESFVGKQGAEVLAWLILRGQRGGTQKEACRVLGIERPSLCARFNALEHIGDIKKTARRRDGCVVYIAR